MRALKAILPRGLDPAIALGLVATVVYYSTMFLVPRFRDSILFQYTAKEWVEYIIVTFMCCGIADIVLKLAALPAEKLALKATWLPVRQGREPVANATKLLQSVRQQSEWLQESRIGKRLALALGFITEKGRADEYHEHLQYLADQDEEQAHASFGLIRFVMGASPVLGFLGTVIHFGTALSGSNYNDLADRLPTVVTQMGAAFNTTTVALAAALSMMLSLFLLERMDRGVLRAIDRFIERELANRFEIKEPSLTPFVGALQAASDETMKTMQATLTRQIELIQQSLAQVFERFEQRQQQETQHWQQALGVLQQRHQAYDSALEERLRQSVVAVDQRHDQQLRRMESLLEQALSVRDDFGALTRTIQGLAQGEGQLVQQQRVLSDNLRVLRESSQIDQALHGLTAAIHLMTARSGVVREAA